MDIMDFPQTVDEFMEQYKIVDREKVYTNGAEMVPIFRMKQWFEHEALKKAPTALDHIHNVVAEREYQRGYEQGKTETNCPEIPDSWTPVTEKMPEEKDTMFAKFWGTERWNEYMFRKKSDLVEVTVELEDGTRYTDASRTRDGKWDIEMNHGAVKKKVVAWKPMSAPWRGNVDAEVQNDKN